MPIFGLWFELVFNMNKIWPAPIPYRITFQFYRDKGIPKYPKLILLSLFLMEMEASCTKYFRTSLIKISRFDYFIAIMMFVFEYIKQIF